MAVAARAMRHILIDYARQRQAPTACGPSAALPVRSLEVEAIHCVALLDAWSAFTTGAEATDARVVALDRLLTEGGREARLIRKSGLLLARIYEAAGDPARAIRALDRSHFRQTRLLRFDPPPRAGTTRHHDR